MRKNGFTLIELLAVIVLLAIIALIATPIILGIINDAREESQERSAELYLSGVDLAVARRNLTEEFSPKECTIANGVVTCEGYEEPLYVDVDGEVPISGTIKFEDNKTTTGTTLTFKSFTATLNEQGKIVIGDSEESGDKFEIGKLSSVCEPAETQYFQETAMEPGYEYNCKVDPNKEPYTFYVLNKTENQINLIMDSNINISGRAVKGQETDLGKVVWSLDYMDYGTDLDENPILYKSPIEALEYLQTATAGWTNVTPQEINSLEYDRYEDGTTILLMPMQQTYTSNARLPYYRELYDSGEYIYDNLRLDCFDYEGNFISCEGVLDGSVEGFVEYGYHLEGLEHIEDVNGYWILFTIGAVEVAKALDYGAAFPSQTEYHDASYGVRPVITLDIQ